MHAGRRRPRALWFVLLSLAVGGSIVFAGVSSAAMLSGKLHGQMLNIQNFGGPGCPSPTGVCSHFVATGSIKGDGLVSVDTFPTADGLSKAHTIIHTRKGDLTCSEWAIFDVAHADHAFVDLCLITGGTGEYAGATGYIQEVGTFDFASNVGELEYYGKLIRP